MPTRIAGKVAIAIVKGVRIGLEAFFAERGGHLLRIPDHGILYPARRVGRLAPGGQPIGVSGLEGQGRVVRIDQKAGIKAHQAERDLEGRGGRHAGGAIALGLQNDARIGILQKGADRSGGG